jgi:hypothetical protein
MTQQEQRHTSGEKLAAKEGLVPPEMVLHHLTAGREWTTVGLLLSDQGVIACPDDRETDPIIGAFAGDFGLLHQAASAVEQQLGRSLSSTELEALFDGYLQKYGQLYMHNGEHGVLPLAQKFQADALLGQYLTESDPERLVAQFKAIVNKPYDVFTGMSQAQVTQILHERLLPHLISPEFIDCGHIKNMLLNPEEYEARLGLTQELLSVYFKRMWEGANVQWRVIPHDHKAHGVLQIETRGDLSDMQHTVPQIRPRVGDSQFFVKHTNLVEYVRGKIYDEVVSAVDFGHAIDRGGYMQYVHHLTEVRRSATLKRLAVDKPVITASINGQHDWYLNYEGHVTVSDSGEVSLVQDPEYVALYEPYSSPFRRINHSV